ncbi:MAG: hypothetical protein IPM99_15815 [Rubrivivax sp.]|nr:hypothetical protein [Rubrivivax sp.]
MAIDPTTKGLQTMRYCLSKRERAESGEVPADPGGRCKHEEDGAQRLDDAFSASSAPTAQPRQRHEITLRGDKAYHVEDDGQIRGPGRQALTQDTPATGALGWRRLPVRSNRWAPAK